MKKTASLGLLMAPVLLSVSTVMAENATLTTIKRFSNHYEYINSNGKRVGTTLNYDHYAQPNTYTCGAANITAYIDYELKKEGYSANFSDKTINVIYNLANTNGTTGLVPDEIKSFFNKYNSYFSNKYGGFNFNMYEAQYDNASTGVDNIDKFLNKKKSAIFIYGNTKLTSNYLGAGSHYYTTFGSINCNLADCSFNFKGVRLNDSVFGSNSYPGRQSYPDSIPHTYMINSDALKVLWEGTGGRYPWQRKHTALLING